MPKRLKAEMAAMRARLAEPVDPETELELTRRRLAFARDSLIEFEAGTHGFANSVEMTAKLIELTRADILRFEAIIAKQDRSKP